jgi:hypothetical protein
MQMKINWSLQPSDLKPKIEVLWALSAAKLSSIEDTWEPSDGAPVFTIEGRYSSRGWTEWTQGFQFGSSLLQFDATGEESFLEIGRTKTVKWMAPHVTHFGVHDHGFNNVSTYGNLWRLMNEKRIPESAWERCFYELALKCSAAVQANRWTQLDGAGFIYSFNGPHSLFADTIRSLRVLAIGQILGHSLLVENDREVSLLERLVDHAGSTSRFNIYFGEGRDSYDVPGRVAHESIFNLNGGSYRNPSTQQGFSPFSTWSRGLAWIICGYAEQLEFLDRIESEGSSHSIDLRKTRELMLRAARTCSDYYILETPLDGIPYWDFGAPGLHRIGDCRNMPAQIANDFEPVDSSAAAIASQGLLRLGHYLGRESEEGKLYWQAGLTVLNTLFGDHYLSSDDGHQGLILHSVYHRPGGWDHRPSGKSIPVGEATMWGDYHAREVALYLERIINKGTYLTFFGP